MTTIISKPDTILKLGEADIESLRKLVQRLSDKVWNSEDERKENDFFCFHHTKHIVFRFIHGNRDHRNFYSTPIWDVWSQFLLPVMMATVVPYNFENPVFPKVMLARLEAGESIDRHIDGAGSNLHTHKIHIPLYTNPDVKFYIKDKPHFLAEGFAYEVNNIVYHSVENKGRTDRIHFIFEVYEGGKS